jgi:tRNA pseudouridine55 synthase
MADHGFLLIDKPADLTSFQVIAQLRQITSIKRIGHTGTLDPFATGLLPVCLGSATRLARFLSSEKKTYEATIRFGKKSDTADITGKIIATAELPDLSDDLLQAATQKILQQTSQTPPAFSALKINGKRAYQFARQGEQIKLVPRPVKVYDFQVTDYQRQTLSYQTTVSKGTYIRTLSETFAEFLGTCAITENLRRLAVGNLKINSSIKLSELSPENWRSHLLPPHQVLPLPRIILNEQQAIFFQQGRLLPIQQNVSGDLLVVNSSLTKTYGIATINQNGLLKPEIVLAG